MSIKYLTGDALSPQVQGSKIIAHICNDIGGWGKGFVTAISNKWKEPEIAYRNWYRDRNSEQSADGEFRLGAIQLVAVEKANTWVANMVAQRGTHAKDGVPPIRYDALESCLRCLSPIALEHSASVHMPRIGCGLAGGKWEQIEPLIQKELSDKGIETYVYDFAS